MSGRKEPQPANGVAIGHPDDEVLDPAEADRLLAGLSDSAQAHADALAEEAR